MTGRLAAPAALLLLAGCQSQVSVQAASSGALDADHVRLAVDQVLLRDSGGTVVPLDSDDTGVKDWLAFGGGATLTLVSGARLPQGHYVGLALAFGASGAELDHGGATDPIDVSNASGFTGIDVSVQGNDTLTLWVGMDLRLSLSDQTSSGGGFALLPRLNVVDLGHAGSLSGTIAASVEQSQGCLQGRTAPDGAAVYAYPVTGLAPYDDSASAAPHPTATAKVAWNADDTGSYAFPHLAPGSYTIALSCVASQDDPIAAQGLTFAARGDVAVREGGAATLDLP